MTTVTLTPASSSPWTIPTNVTEITVTCQAAGGGSSGSVNLTSGGSGGGGGALSQSVLTGLTPAGTIAFSIGSGGIAGTSGGGAGGTGGDTWFSSSSTIMAKGGTGGTANGAAGGTGGAAASGFGTIKHSGGNGAAQNFGTGGGGGGSAGSASDGTNASGATGGGAGTSELAGGTNSPTGVNGAAGNINPATVGSVAGGGAGGGPNSAIPGGAGGDGRIIIQYTTLAEATAWWTPVANSGGNLVDQIGGTHLMTGNGIQYLSDGTYTYAEVRSSGGPDWLTTPNTTDLNVSSGDFTVVMLLIPRVSTSSFTVWSAKGADTLVTGWTLYVGSNTVFGAFRNAADAQNNPQSLGSVAVGTRYAVALTRSNNTLRVVIDGSSGTGTGGGNSGITTTGSSADNSDAVYVGRASGGTNPGNFDLYGMAWFKGSGITNADVTFIGAQLLAATLTPPPIQTNFLLMF